MLKDIRHQDHFLFTQFSLATFDNCPLKFKKRYIENLKWNNFMDDEIRKGIELGNSFHLLAYRYFLGIDLGLHEGVDGFSELSTWINNLKDKFVIEKNSIYLPEYKLRMITTTLKLEANFDLLIVRDGEIEIWDWKTHIKSTDMKENPENRIKKTAKKLRESMQTMVYMFVLKELASLVCGKDTECDRIKMTYWQPDPPKVITQISYNEEMHNRFREIIENKIKHIYEYDYLNFDKNEFVKHCKFCEFNWFCNNEMLDFDQISKEDDFLEELNWDETEEVY